MLIRVIAAIVDSKELTLYKEDGSTHVIPQGDPRIKDIVKAVTPMIVLGQVAEVDLTATNNYKEFEEKSGGFVKFFRVAKKFVKHIFNPDEDENIVEPTVLGSIPVTPNPVQVEKQANIAKINHAVDEIIANAEPVSTKGFDHTKTTDDETIISVVATDNGVATIIPGMENLEKQFAYASKMGSTQGVTNFLKRIAAVIDKRGHSIDDLLRFMEKGDLPIADDGSIIAYKVLASKNDVYVDCHTRNVPQRVGSYVCMDPSLVDPNRRNECSNGLHIARRGYLGSFSGDAIVLCKIAPEDVIAVPQYDPNKVRVCGYHILFEIPKSEHKALRNDQSMTGNTEAKRMLGMAIKGDHIEKIEEVRITEQKGGGIKITPFNVKTHKVPNVHKQAPEAESIDKAEYASVDPKQVAQDAFEAKGTNAPTPTPKAEPKKDEAREPTRNEKARQLYTAKDFDGLALLKKTAKIGWDKLGFTDAEITNIHKSLSKPAPVGLPKKAAKPKAEPKIHPEVAKIKIKKATPATNEKELPKMEGNRVEIARELFTKATSGDKASWGHLWLHKKRAKQNWEKLGFTQKEAERIETNKPDWV